VHRKRWNTPPGGAYPPPRQVSWKTASRSIIACGLDETHSSWPDHSGSHAHSGSWPDSMCRAHSAITPIVGFIHTVGTVLTEGMQPTVQLKPTVGIEDLQERPTPACQAAPQTVEHHHLAAHIHHRARCLGNTTSIFMSLRFGRGLAIRVCEEGKTMKKTVAVMMLLAGGLFAAPRVTVGVCSSN
jgi:hypothetical protein